jgi:regulator of protease activity HflC (stomatin/prohibitin superfamily)
MPESFLGIIIGIIVVAWVLFYSIRIVPEYQRLVIFRLGRVLGKEKGPGLAIVLPFIDKPVRVDLREFVLEIPQQTCITRDNASISIDFLIYLRVINPTSSVVSIQDFSYATRGLATTTLRAIIGDIDLDNVLSKREEINAKLQAKLDDVTQRWGVKVTTVEIREITPPREVQDAMTKQMAAERTRRAMVTEAEGIKQSEILKAEGEKQAKILESEGARQSQILVAEGEKQARILVAEGTAQALEKIFGVAKGIESNTLALQYLDALRAIASSPSAKILFPMELTSFIEKVFKK